MDSTLPWAPRYWKEQKLRVGLPFGLNPQLVQNPGNEEEF